MRYQFIRAVIAGSFLLATLASGAERVTSSAHGEALYLVLTDQAEELRRLDPDVDSLETKVRSWSVTRPVDSGILDMANTFTVTLSIDGHPVASWYVNTGEGTVEPRKLVVQPASP